MVNVGGRCALPLWRCGGCPDAAYSEGRPAGWAWSKDAAGVRALLCGVCRIRVVGERRKARKSLAQRRTEPAETHRACAGPGCDSVFELGVKRTKRFCSVVCRSRANNRKAAGR